MSLYATGAGVAAAAAAAGADRDTKTVSRIQSERDATLRDVVAGSRSKVCQSHDHPRATGVVRFSILPASAVSDAHDDPKSSFVCSSIRLCGRGPGGPAGGDKSICSPPIERRRSSV
jgi:hypothetical protein